MVLPPGGGVEVLTASSIQGEDLTVATTQVCRPMGNPIVYTHVESCSKVSHAVGMGCINTAL